MDNMLVKQKVTVCVRRADGCGHVFSVYCHWHFLSLRLTLMFL